MKRILFLSLLVFSLNKRAQSQCNAAFTYSITNSIVNFNSDTLAYGVSLWYFGDGSLAWSSYTTHSYNAPGAYNVKHIVIDSLNNCTDSSVQTINVNFTPSCNASFQYYRDSTNLARYYFNDASTIIGSTYKSSQWTIDNNVVSNDAWFSYTFPRAGTYHVCEQLQTYSGCTSSSCMDIVVTSIDSCSLSASFTYIPDSSNPLSIKFKALTDTAVSVSYYWSFGDGTVDTARTPTHLYSKGMYNAYLYVRKAFINADSCSAFASLPVYVNITPADTCSASFAYSRDPVKPNVISFTAISNQPLISQTWYISNGAGPYPYDSIPEFVLEKNNPTFTFADTGIYYVSLKTTAESGCVAYSNPYNIQFIYIDSIAQNTASPNSAAQIPAYPNPATNNVNLDVTLPSGNSITINVYNAMGNLTLTKQVAGSAGNNQIAIPVQTLKPGVYYLEINYGSEVKRSRFQKL